MSEYQYESINELVEYAKEAEGKYLTEIDKRNLLSSGNKKAYAGYIIEESYFGISANSTAQPDFPHLGIELKTTGVVKRKRGNLVAKERLVLNIINYMTEVDLDFFNSSFWKKNNKLLIFFYSYVRDQNGKPDYKNFEILSTVLHEFSEFDLEIIKQDWANIQQKIKNGEAHLLSEGDTNILGACTKGASKDTLRIQPFSDIPAKQRAFSLKQGYMSTLVDKYILNKEHTPFVSSDDVSDKNFEDIIKEYFVPYLNKTVLDIAHSLNIELNMDAKNKYQLLVSAILGIKRTNLEDTEEFAKLNIKFKTIMLEQSGSLKESMSFEHLDFNEIYHVPYDYSDFKIKFESTQWLFVVFQKDDKGTPWLRKIKLWHVPEEILNNEIRKLYNEVKRLMKEEGIIETKSGKRYLNNLPKSKFNGVCHVRPKGTNREKSMIDLPNGDRIPNQCFWFNSQYIRQIIQ